MYYVARMRNSKWKIYSIYTIVFMQCGDIKLKSKTRYLAKKELVNHPEYIKE